MMGIAILSFFLSVCLSFKSRRRAGVQCEMLVLFLLTLFKDDTLLLEFPPFVLRFAMSPTK